MSRRLPLSLLLLATSAGLGAQETVSLDFAWPAGAADVVVTTSMSAGVMGQTNRFDNRMGYRMTVAVGDDGYVVSYSDFTFDGEGMDELMSDAGGGEDLSRVLASMQPDILVTPDGHFAGLANYEDLRASMEEMMATLRSQMQAVGAGEMFDEMMESSLSEEAVTRNAELGWKQLAGYWAGRTLAPGETVMVSDRVSVPMLGNQEVAVETELQLVGRVACDEGGEGRACLELVSRATPDGEELRTLMDVFMAEMMERQGGPGMEMGISEMTMDTHTSLIVDAGTLRPLRMETELDMTIGMDVMGNVQTMQNRQVANTTFTWGAS